MTGRRASVFLRGCPAPRAAVAVALLVVVAVLVAAEVDLPRHLWNALDLVVRAYVVAFLDAAMFRLLCS